MFKITEKKLSPLSIHVRYGLTSALTAPIIGSFLYGYTNHHSPFQCLILSFTGIPCPSCGLTRSFVALAQGKILLSLQKHLFGLPLFIFFLLTTILSSCPKQINFDADSAKTLLNKQGCFKVREYNWLRRLADNY